MQNNQYISILTTAASAGTIQFTLQTLDAASNVTIVASCTGLTTSQSETSLAQSIKSQLTTLTLAASYTGTPSSLAQGPQATFRFNNTDHIVEVFSESRFNLSVTSNTTGAIVKVGDVPCLITVAQATSVAYVTDQTFETGDGVAYTNTQIADLIELISAKIITLLNNPIVATTYRHETYGNWQKGIELAHTPVISVDTPSVYFPGNFNFLITDQGTTSKDLYFFEDDGDVTYRFAQEIIDCVEPFDYGNLFRMTYIAGYGRIPTIVRLSLVELVSAEIETGEVLSLSGGSFSVKIGGEKSILQEKLSLLSKYQN